MTGNARPGRVAWVLAAPALALLAATLLLYALAPQPKAETAVSNWTNVMINTGALALGLFITLRQPRNRYGWTWLVYSFAMAIASLAGALFQANGSRADVYRLPLALLFWADEPVAQLALVCLILIVLWFPTGWSPSRRWRFVEWWLFVGYVLFVPYWFVSGPLQGGNSSVKAINPLGFIPPGPVLSTFGLLGFLSLVISGLLAVISVAVRFRHGSPIERQQIKWFLLGGAGLASLFLGGLFSIAQGPWWVVYNCIVFMVVYLSLGFAMVRYRLYDVDVIIRRTLVYTALTALLALAYFGSVLVMQGILSALTGQSQSSLVTVLSTLVIAALFVPLRGRVQSGIDRRFYRRRYDAARTLAAFGASLRDETNLEALSARVVDVVEATLQPDVIALWLAPAANRPADQDSRS